MSKAQNKILSLQQGIDITTEWKKGGEKVVFTNGCFDIIHLGHVDYLEKARELGTKLIIGLNTDASIRRIKGPQRPVQDERSRSRILASFAFTDAVILFDEDTPYNLIKALKPDILVKGNDYAPQNIIGADIVNGYGGDVITIELITGYSTSEIIKKIKDTYQ